MYTYIVAVNKQLFTKYNAEWVFKQVSFSISLGDFTFGFNQGSNTSKVNISSEFVQYSHTERIFVGGTTQGYNSGYKAWMQSVLSNPAPLDFRLVPLSDLVSDPAVKANLDAAVLEYTNTNPNNSRKREEEHS